LHWDTPLSIQKMIKSILSLSPAAYLTELKRIHLYNSQKDDSIYWNYDKLEAYSYKIEKKT